MSGNTQRLIQCGSVFKMSPETRPGLKESHPTDGGSQGLNKGAPGYKASDLSTTPHFPLKVRRSEYCTSS